MYNNLSRNILLNHGGLSRNCLIESINANSNDNDVNNNNIDQGLNLIKKSNYHDLDQFTNHLRSHQNTLNIMSINIQGINTSFSELQVLTSHINNLKLNLDIMALQECHLSEDDMAAFDLTGYARISSDPVISKFGGLTTYIRDDLDYKIKKKYVGSNLWEGQFFEFTLKANRKKIIFGNIYKKCSNYNVSEMCTLIAEFEPILHDLSKDNAEVIICGDFNMNLLKLDQYEKYDEFFELFLSQGFFPNITLPTRITNTTATLIDQIYCKSYESTQNSYSGILVSKISDHFPTFIFKPYKLNFLKQPNKMNIRQTGPQQIENFKTELGNFNWDNLINRDLTQNIDQIFDNFFENFSKMHEKCLPIISVRNNKHKYARNKWVTPGLLQSIKYRDKLYTKLKKMNISNPRYNSKYAELRRFNVTLRNSLNAAKKLFYDNEFNKFKGDMKKTWNTISSVLGRKKMKSVFPNKMKTENGSEFAGKTNIANEFNKLFTDNNSEDDNLNNTNNINFASFLRMNINSNFRFQAISLDSLESIVKNLQPKHSFGYDELSPLTFKNIFTCIKQPLLKLINLSLLNGIFPNKLKLAKVVPVFKKNEANQISNYRPISLLPTFSKIFEKVAFSQMYEYLTENNILFNSQHGFRSNHSTETAAIEFIDHIKSEISRKHTPISIFLDLSRAFDTVDHSILLNKLGHYGFAGSELRWFESYLTNRSQYVTWDGIKSETMPCKKGVPQGSILGPLLFLIYVNDLNFASKLFKLVCYADDSNLVLSLCLHQNQSSRGHLFCIKRNYESLINNELDKVVTWLEANKLSLNVSKTKFMIFHNRQFNITNHIPILKIRNEPIVRVNEFPFLGIIINENVNWKSHINYISKKISKTLGVMNRIKKFVPKTCLKNIYQSLIHSHLNYGIILWGYDLSKLAILQKKAVRILSQSHYLAHTEPLFKKENILKINEIFKMHSFKIYYNFINNTLPSSIRGLFQLNNFTNNHHLILFNCSDAGGKNRIRYSLPRLINNAPLPFLVNVHTHSKNNYKLFLKKHFINEYSYSPCLNPNCYPCNRNRISS